MMYERIEWAQPHCYSKVLNGNVWFAEPYLCQAAVVPRRSQIWIERERAIYEGGRTFDVANETSECMTAEGKRDSIILAQIRRPARKASSFSHLLLIIDGPAVYLATHVAICSHAIGQGKIRVEFDGPVEQAKRLANTLVVTAIKIGHST